MTWTISSAAGIQLRPLGDAAAVYRPFELAVSTDRNYDNPFDPDEIAIDAEFTSAEGKRFRIPAFWRQPAGDQQGDAGFRVRFAPPTAGKWTASVIARDRTGERRSDAVSLDVKPGDSHGFVTRSPNSSQYFQFDDGAPYFLIGLNIGWVHGSEAQTYDSWFEKLGKAGGNFARVWMCHGGVYLESERSGGIGRYDPNSAAYFDRVLELAQKRGIGIMLCFINHREMLVKDMWGQADWPKHAYNAANGGPATRPADFFTNADARKFFKRRLRYMVARYSAYTSLAFWELINEQEHIPTPVPDAWNLEMASYLKQLDPYRRPVTTSANVPPATWESADIDLTQMHLYGDGTVADGITPIVAAVQRHRRFNKPHFIGEYGISYKGPDAQFDPNNIGTALHNSLWAATFSGAAGASAHWWWDNYVDPKNQWHHYTPIAKFAATIDWPRRTFEPLALPPPQLRSVTDEQYSDLTLDCSGGFAKVDEDLVTISPSGAVDRPLTRFYFGPSKATHRGRAAMTVNMPVDGDLVLRVGDVSDYAMLRVWVDDKPVSDLAFSALPGSADVEKTDFHPEFNNIYQARLNKDRKVALTAGTRRIAIENLAGDWVSVETMTFTRARSSRFDSLAALAIRDEAAGETLVWLYDVTSNWMSDRDGVDPRKHRDVCLKVPVSSNQTFTAEWWDTWHGEMIKSEQVQPSSGVLDLSPPTFVRDIALRITRAR